MTRSNIFDELEEGIIKINDRLEVVYSNLSAKKLLGDVINKPVSDALHVPKISDIVEKFIINEEFDCETSYTKDNSKIFLYIKSRPPYLIFEEITSKKLLENAKMDFVNSLVHEFSTPLTVINGYTQILTEKKEELPDEVSNAISRILKSVVRLSRLVDELGTLSNLELKNYQSHSEIINLASLMEEIISDFEQRLKRKNLKINLEIPEYLYVKSDSVLLYRVMVNLISNAIKYSFEGERIEIGAYEKGKNICISVRDYGLGIRSDELPRIFERFYRASNAKSERISGLGLGLALVKHAIAIMDATIDVESNYMMGTTFTIKLPADSTPVTKL